MRRTELQPNTERFEVAYQLRGPFVDVVVWYEFMPFHSYFWPAARNILRIQCALLQKFWKCYLLKFLSILSSINLFNPLQTRRQEKGKVVCCLPHPYSRKIILYGRFPLTQFTFKDLIRTAQ
jgi:hypothetical protein